MVAVFWAFGVWGVRFVRRGTYGGDGVTRETTLNRHKTVKPIYKSRYAATPLLNTIASRSKRAIHTTYTTTVCKHGKAW